MMGLSRLLRFIQEANHKVLYDCLIISFLTVKFTILVNFIPLRYYYRRYFGQQNDEFQDLQPFKAELSLIRRVNRNWPWHISCLMHSLTVKEFLKRKGILVNIAIGIKKSNGLQAHAWYLNNTSNGFQRIV